MARMPRATAVRDALRAAVASRPSGRREGDRSARALLGQGQQVGGLTAAQRVPDRGGDTVLEAHTVADGVDEVVDPGDVLVVGAGQAGQAQGGSLDRHRRVAAGEVDDRFAGPSRQGAGPPYGCGVEVEEGART